MQHAALILGGFEAAYMQKLALYLGSRFGEQPRVGIAESVPTEVDSDTIFVGSADFLEAIRAKSGDAGCILLAEEPDDEEAIYRYQSCEKLYQQIIARYRQLQGVPADAPRTARQRWIAITSDTGAADLLAFSATCAQILGEGERVLYVNLSELSGMAELFLLERGADLSELVAALRKEEPVCLEAFVRQMEGMDFIMPPANPMILHELEGSDIARLIGAIGSREEYRFVVVALGAMCCGCEQVLRMAKRILHLTGRGYTSECSKREWTAFFSLCFGGEQIPVEVIGAPQIPAESSGIHLLHNWREGALGQLARVYLAEEAKG